MTTRADLVAAIAVERGAVRMARAHGQTGQTGQDRVDDLVARLVDLDRAAASTANPSASRPRMTGGAFTPATRDAILNASGDGRCAGCGATPVTCQHRRARGMGGTRLDSIAQAVNGVPLCGDGVRGCHGWTEANPTLGGLLGWRLGPGEDPLEVPFWTRLLGWRRWVLDAGVPLTVHVAEADLGEEQDARDLAVVQLRRHLANR